MLLKYNNDPIPISRWDYDNLTTNKDTVDFAKLFQPTKTQQVQSDGYCDFGLGLDNLTSKKRRHLKVS